jgi:hypothetical protein
MLNLLLFNKETTRAAAHQQMGISANGHFSKWAFQQMG